jgi:hypothetical protein
MPKFSGSYSAKTEGWLGVDEPVLFPERREVGSECPLVAQAVEVAE